MSEKILLKSLVVALGQALVYAPLSIAGQLSLPSGHPVASVISPGKFSNTAGQVADYQITVTATDNVGVMPLNFCCGTIDTDDYKRKTMDDIVNTDDCLTMIDSDQVEVTSVEYYLQVMDSPANTNYQC